MSRLEPGASRSAIDPLGHAAAAHPDGGALTWAGPPSIRLSFRELDAGVARFAAWLRALGIRAGDRVAILARNRPELVVGFHATARTSACLVPLNVRLTTAELAQLVARAAPRILLVDPALAEKVPPWAGPVHSLADAPSLDVLPGLDGAPAPSSATAHDGDARDHAAVAALFTSGTTGIPKLVELTRGNFAASARASAANLGDAPGQRWLLTMPLFHVGGLAMVHRCAVLGAELVLEPGFDARRTSAWLDAGITHASLVPTTLGRLLDERGERPFPSSVLGVLIGGGPTPPALLARARRLGLPVLQTYGLTEACSQVATERPGDADGTTAGWPLPGVEVRVVTGEIQVRGPTVAPALGPWLATGDLGRIDARGRLVILARRHDLIVSGGENIYPAEVEAVLSQHPAVAELAVVPVPEPHFGQVPAALIVWRDAPQPADLMGWARDRLAGFKLPRRLVAAASLPRTATGKLDRRAVMRLVGELPHG